MLKGIAVKDQMRERRANAPFRCNHIGILCWRVVRVPEPGKRPLWPSLLVTLLVLLPAVLRAQFSYVTNDGTITITGYAGTGGEVVIPAFTNGLMVTEIKTNAFFNCTNITSVTIPGSVGDIPYMAFSQCTGLTNVTIGKGTFSIGDHAFYDCEALAIFSDSEV